MSGISSLEMTPRSETIPDLESGSSLMADMLKAQQ
jgi:hypothetical protein